MRKLLSLLLLVGAFRIFAYDVVLLSDTHYDAREYHPGVKKIEGSTKRNLDAWEKRMPEMLKVYRKLAKEAAFVIHGGDLAHGNFSKKDDAIEIEAVTKGIETFAKDIPCKFYCVKGNHETYCVNPAEASDKVIGNYLKSIGVAATGLNYAVVHEGDLYIFFDCITPDMEFLKRTLAANPKARHTFLVTHWPVLPASKSVSKKWLIYRKKAKTQELLELLASRNAIVLCGHIHNTTLVRAKFDKGTITQMTVYSLSVSDDFEVKQKSFTGAEFLEKWLKTAEKDIPEPYAEVIRQNYQNFTHYMPQPGVFRMSVEAEKVELEQYSYQGKLLNRIIVWPQTDK